MELKRVTDEFVESVNKSMETFKAMAGKAVFDKNMEPEYVDMMKDLFKLVDVSLALVAEQSKVIQDMDHKLDLLTKVFAKEEES